VRLAHRTFAHSSSAFPLPAARADSPIWLRAFYFAFLSVIKVRVSQQFNTQPAKRKVCVGITLQ
jgi:hypothetical protein